jgi:hypothetical protein
MLSVLRFKKSLFAGVLDHGDAEVSLGGSRLKKFMETVEAATGGIPAAVATEAEEAAEARREFTEKPSAAASDGEEPSAAVAPADPWGALLQAGAALLQQWTAPRAEGAADGAASLVRKDEQTGETYLRLPVPSDEVVGQALKAVEGLLAHFRRGSS